MASALDPHAGLLVRPLRDEPTEPEDISTQPHDNDRYCNDDTPIQENVTRLCFNGVALKFQALRSNSFVLFKVRSLHLEDLRQELFDSVAIVHRYLAV